MSFRYLLLSLFFSATLFSCKNENAQKPTNNLFKFKEYINFTTSGVISVAEPIRRDLSKEVESWVTNQAVSKNIVSISPKVDDTQGKYYVNEFVEPSYLANFEPDFGEVSTGKTIFDADSVYLTFEVFEQLPIDDWFEIPFDELIEVTVCDKSGYRAGEFCEIEKNTLVQQSGLKTKPCPFHKWVHLDKNEEFQVNSSCEIFPNIVHKSWFVLPPLMEYYYQKKNPFYKKLPNFRKDCLGEHTTTMDFIVPKENTTFYLTKSFDEQQQGVVMKLVHSNSEAIVFWYLNEKYLGATQNIHEIEIKPETGNFKITVFDEFGNEIHRKIQIKN